MVTERRQQEINDIVKDNFAVILQNTAKQLVEDKQDDFETYDVDMDSYCAMLDLDEDEIIDKLFISMFNMELTCQGEDEIFKEALVKHIDGKWQLTLNIVKSWMKFFEV